MPPPRLHHIQNKGEHGKQPAGCDHLVGTVFRNGDIEKTGYYELTRESDAEEVKVRSRRVSISAPKATLSPYFHGYLEDLSE